MAYQHMTLHTKVVSLTSRLSHAIVVAIHTGVTESDRSDLKYVVRSLCDYLIVCRSGFEVIFIDGGVQVPLAAEELNSFPKLCFIETVS